MTKIEIYKKSVLLINIVVLFVTAICHILWICMWIYSRSPYHALFIASVIIIIATNIVIPLFIWLLMPIIGKLMDI